VNRNEKGRALSRFLTGRTGIPMLSWDYMESRIDAPPPYRIDVTTSAKIEHFRKLLMDKPGTSTHMVIRFDKFIPGIEGAWVGMRLADFTPLLTAHYQTISDRINTYKMGD